MDLRRRVSEAGNPAAIFRGYEKAEINGLANAKSGRINADVFYYAAGS
jgi:hypothetical protein